MRLEGRGPVMDGEPDYSHRTSRSDLGREREPKMAAGERAYPSSASGGGSEAASPASASASMVSAVSKRSSV